MSVTADSGKRPLQDVTATSSSSATPGESPLKSLSATSLSSIDSEGGVSAEKLATTLIEIQKKRETPKEQYGKLVDTYGNEFQVPNFTIKQIRDAIPAHCFDRSAARSLMVVGRDILFLAIVFIVFRILVTPENIPSKIIRTALWLIGYTVIQGCIATGLWVMAHECGHQAFSSSKMLNDTVGFVCHSMLLVPYFSWKISHSKHHKSTGHMDRDMVFVPKTRDEYASRVGKLAHELTELGEEAPIVTLVSMIGQQLLGWPLYLLINVTGHNNHGRQSEGRGLGKTNGWYGGVNHFNPKSPLYGAKDMSKILYSDLGIIVVGGALYLIGQNFGWANLAVWYGIPYLWVNFWLGKFIGIVSYSDK